MQQEVSMTSKALAQVAPLQQALVLATEAGDITALKDVQAMASALQKGAQARGMGIEAENQAAEVVIRAERAIGAILLSIPRATPGPKPGSFAIVGREGPRNDTGERVSTSPSEAKPTSLALAIEAAGLGRNPKGAQQYQRLAAMPDERFEAMLSELHTLGSRISKVNFYRAPKDASSVNAEPAPTPTSPAFALFRAGAQRLLGWTVDADGVGAPTTNMLLTLPSDELSQVAALMTHLVTAYNEARRAR